MPLDIVTFGCRLNAFESEAIRGHAQAAGLDDAIIVNTCAVTAEAERQARQTIRKLRRERPGARLIVTGCAAQIDPARFAAMAEVDHVLGNAEKLRPETYRDLVDRVSAGDIFALRETAPHLVEAFDGRARAFVQVQQGCDHRCTFCVIPFARGASRSVPIDAAIAQARLLVERGYRELVLTGVDITAYGLDLSERPSLGAVCRGLLAAIPELTRLRLSSLDVAEIDDALWSLIADEPRLMPHLHLSLQAGNDLILKRMKRRHSRAQAVAAAIRARDLCPGIALGADLIAGFPTETDADVRQHAGAGRGGPPRLSACLSLQSRGPARRPRACRRYRATLFANVAPASVRSGAQVLARSLARRVGSVAEVLIERDGFGRSEHYAPVRFDAALATGSVVAMRLGAGDDTALKGVPL